MMPPIARDVLSLTKFNTHDFYMELGRSFTGAYSPVLDVTAAFVKNLQGEKTAGRLTARALEDFTPLRTHPALAALYERLIFDNIKLALDPEAHLLLAKREKFRRDQGLVKLN